MLDKRTRKKFIEQRFEKIKKNDSNWPQSWSRLREKVKVTFNDISLLAIKLPDEYFDELITPLMIESFCEDVLKNRGKQELNATKARLAATFARCGLQKCKYQNEKMEDQPPLRFPIEDTLDRASNIASSIATKIEEKNRFSRNSTTI